MRVKIKPSLIGNGYSMAVLTSLGQKAEMLLDTEYPMVNVKWSVKTHRTGFWGKLLESFIGPEKDEKFDVLTAKPILTFVHVLASGPTWKAEGNIEWRFYPENHPSGGPTLPEQKGLPALPRVSVEVALTNGLWVLPEQMRFLA